MSWDLYIHKHKSYPEPDEATPSDIIPLGTVKEVREALSKNIPVVWSEHFWGNYESDEAILEFDVGSMKFDINEVINVATVQVRGGSEPLAVILKFCKENEWSLFDTASGAYIKQTSPNIEGQKIAEEAKESAIKRILKKYF